MENMSFRTKLVLYSGLLVAVIGLGVAWGAWWMDQEAHRGEEFSRLHSNLKYSLSVLEDQTQGDWKRIQGQLNDPFLQSALRRTLQKGIRRKPDPQWKTFLSEYEALIVLDPFGRVIFNRADSSEPFIGVALGGIPLVQRCQDKGRAVGIWAPQDPSLLDYPFAPQSRPYWGVAHRIQVDEEDLGTLIVGRAFDVLLLEPLSRLASGQATVWSSGLTFGAPLPLPAGWIKGEGGSSFFQKISSQKLIGGLAFQPLGTQLGFVGVAVENKSSSFWNHYVRFLALFFVLAFVSAVFLMGRVGAHLARPLRELADATHLVGEGDFGVKIPIQGSDEVARVQSAFNLMSDRIEELLEGTRSAANMEIELKLAQNVQTILIPGEEVLLPQHEIYSYRETAYRCGGDWWGFIRHPGEVEKTILLIGDVTGHGTAQALITAAVSGAANMLEKWTATHPNLIPDLLADPRKILEHMNRVVFRAAKGTVSMSFMVMVLDPQNNEVSYASAGHPGALLIRRDFKAGDRPKVLGTAGVMLGEESDSNYEEMGTYTWERGDQLILYTDGLVECFEELGGKNLFGKGHLARFLRSNSRLTGKVLLKQLLATRKKSTGDLFKNEDDVTLVVCHRTG